MQRCSSALYGSTAAEVAVGPAVHALECCDRRRASDRLTSDYPTADGSARSYSSCQFHHAYAGVCG